MMHEQEIRDALTSPKFSHTRSRQWCRVWLTYIYHFDYSSPTCVKLVAAGESALVDPIIKELGRCAPLSPTEPR